MSIHRMEIVTGAGRRRNWSRSFREQVVSETLEPNATVTEVARRHDLDRSLVYRWRRAFGVARRQEANLFLPVEVAEKVVPPGPVAPEIAMAHTSSGHAGRIEIELPNGCFVRVDALVDTEALARVVEVLDRRR